MTAQERDPVDALVETVRNALYLAARTLPFKDDPSLAPVPGYPVGDAHLALDALAARVQELEANGRHLSNLLDWREREKAALAVRVEAAEARVQELEDELQAVVTALPGLPEGRTTRKYAADVAARVQELEALRRISGRYCLHGTGKTQAESACLHKPADQWCSVCIARAALSAEEATDA